MASFRHDNSAGDVRSLAGKADLIHTDLPVNFAILRACEDQRLIKTLPRKGWRFIGLVREAQGSANAAVADNLPPRPATTPPDKPSIAILPFTNLSVEDILRIVRDTTVAEDIVSQVFLDVCRTAGHFEGRCQVSSWLHAIARFKALTALNRRRRHEDIEQSDVREAAAEGAVV